jgi:hypothetical protein
MVMRTQALDISEFRCIQATDIAVSVVFDQTGREYTFAWQGANLALARPRIVGGCGSHAPEIVDCLARAIAHQASQRISAKHDITHAELDGLQLDLFSPDERLGTPMLHS